MAPSSIESHAFQRFANADGAAGTDGTRHAFYAPAVKKVLIVDDSELARALVARQLTAGGLSPVPVARPSDAAITDTQSFAAAVLDLEIGTHSGLDLARDLRARDPSLPIVFLSSSRDEAMLAAARSIGRVFDKTNGVDPAVSYVLSALR